MTVVQHIHGDKCGHIALWKSSGLLVQTAGKACSRFSITVQWSNKR